MEVDSRTHSQCLLRLPSRRHVGFFEQVDLRAMLTLNRHRPKPLQHVDKENVPPKASRLYGGTPQSVGKLTTPFKCPGSASPVYNPDRPRRKRRKLNYAGAEDEAPDVDATFTGDDTLLLAGRGVGKYPVFMVKDKDSVFRQRFAVPLINKVTGEYNAGRPAPLLGMRQGRVFVAKPLHDPSGEFAIVLYDPTIDDPVIALSKGEIVGDDASAAAVVTVEAPLVHKSLAEILGLKKPTDERPRVPVVIDPRLAKVLRPHQIEGVKVERNRLH